MKICHIAANLYAGGAQTFVIMLAVEQKKAGEEVCVILIDEFNHSPFEIFLKRELEKYQIKCISLNRKPGKNFSIFKSFLKLHHEIKAFIPDIINSHLQISHLITAIYLKAVGVSKKLILTIHSAPEEWNYQTLLSNKHTPSIYCSAASQQKSIRRNCLQTIINNGIKEPIINTSANRTLTDLNIPKSHKLVLMVGNFSAVKNYPVAVEVASKFQDKNVSFLVCGIKLETFERDLESFKTVNNVYYLGVKIPDEIYSLMEKSDCFLNTSTVEGLPITVLEALYIGTPCVLSPIMAHYQLSDNMPYCYISDDFKSSSFISKLEEALSPGLSKNEIKEKRKQQLEKYSIANAAKEYISFYKKVIEQ